MHPIARCACGACSVALLDAPKVSCICHCSNCKRRTGSAFGMSSYYLEAALGERAGELAVYAFRHPEEGYDEERYFCKQCGTTLYWRSSHRPHVVGIAGGCLPEDDEAAPSASYSTSGRLAWVTLPARCEALERPSR